MTRSSTRCSCCKGRADEFTTRRPGERKRILADILGLSIYDALEARARAHRNEMDQDVKTLHQRLAELQQDVAQKEELAAAVSAARGPGTYKWSLQAPSNPWSSSASVKIPWNCKVNARTMWPVVCNRCNTNTRSGPATDCTPTPHGGLRAILQQESTILAGYQALQQLREQERVYSAQAEEYTTLQQRQTALQQAITTEQYRLELEQRSTRQRQQNSGRKSRSVKLFYRMLPALPQPIAHSRRRASVT